MTEDVEHTKRANVEELNKVALARFMKESKDERLKNWIDLHNTGVWEVDEDEEELSDAQELFIALLKGDDKDIEEKLYHYVYGSEYNWAHDGGEPDLAHILAVKLLEKLRGEKNYESMIYQDDYLRHVGITYEGKEKEG